MKETRYVINLIHLTNWKNSLSPFIRASLDAAKRQLAERLTRVDVQLSQYEHIGDEFRRIVRIYEGIMRDIEIVEGDIRRMVGWPYWDKASWI